MARRKDKGPYAAWNVKCIPAEDNAKEAWTNSPREEGWVSGKSKLTIEQVTDIYLKLKHSPRGTAALARKYDVDRVTIKAIRRKVTWARITDALD